MSVSIADFEGEPRPEILADYRPLSLDGVGTVSEAEARHLSRSGTVYKVPIWRICTAGISLRALKAIGLRIRPEGGFCFAENDALAVYGTGTSAAEAIEDFYGHVAHFYTYYRNLPDDRLVGDALRMKRLFLSTFLEE